MNGIVESRGALIGDGSKETPLSVVMLAICTSRKSRPPMGNDRLLGTNLDVS